MSGSGPSGGWSPDGQQSGSSAPEMPPSSPRMPPTPSGDSVSDPVPFRRPMPPVEHDEPAEVLADSGPLRARPRHRVARRAVRAGPPGGDGPDDDRPAAPDGPSPSIGPTVARCRSCPSREPLTEHGPARVVSMTNQKGGVGKTTTTINLGASLAEYGRKVLLVDFDPQGSLSVGLGLNPHEMELTIYNLLMQRDVSIEDVVVPTNVEGMDLLPSNIDLSAAEVQLVHEVAREQTLQRVLAPAIAKYDVILIDCQPSLGLLTVNALTASDGVIVPLECEYFALRGVALLKTTIDKVRERLNPKLEIDGVLGTMFDGRTLHGREVMERLVQAWGDRVFHTVIRRTVKFSDSTVAGEPITSYASSLGRCRGLPPARQGGARPVAPTSPRRVSLPAADDLFRPTDPTAGGAGRRGARPCRARRHVTSRARRRGAPGKRRPSGRVKHDEKMTVYVTSDELLDLEQARLVLRRDHGLAVDRGRLVREAVALVLADLDENGLDSLLVQRLTER